MKIKYILLMMAAMGLLGACAEADEQQKAQVGEAVTIQLTANVASETLTMGNPSAWTRDAWDAYQSRALTRGIQETTLINGQKVYLWADKGTAGTYTFLQAWNLTSDGSGGLSGTTKYYPTDGDGLTFRAVHGNFSTTPTEGTAIGTLTHTVLDDQSATGNYEKSDLMYGEGTGSWESAGTVDFVHKLSKIEVNLTPGIGLLPSDMTSATVQIRGVKPTVSINAQTGELGSASGTATTITARHTGNGCFEAVIPPQTAPSGVLTVTIGNVTATIPNAVATFASNSKYVYNVKCTNKDKHLNPLWYVAENNVKSYNSSTKVVTLETDPATAGSSQCYNWFDAMGYFSKQGSSYDEYWSGDITDGSTAFYYHLPCQMELMSIAPVYYVGSDSENMFIDNTNFVQEGNCTEPESIFGYSAETKVATSYKSYWSQYTTANERYALRYLGTPYCSVWKYQFDTGSHVLTMTAKLIDYLPDDTDAATLSSVLSTYMAKSASWWNSNDENEGAVQRKFYAVGLNLAGTGTPNSNANTTGYYWSTKEVSVSTHATYLQSGNERLYCIAADKTLGLTVRLFRSEGPAEARTDPGVQLTSSSIQPGWVITSAGLAYESKTVAQQYGRTPVALVYQMGNTQNTTYTHGVAIALADASTGSTWGSTVSTVCTARSDAFATAKTYMDGVSYTATLVSHSSHSHAAAIAANNYTPTISGAKWFLPSMGQWCAFFNWCNGGTVVNTAWSWNSNVTSYNNVCNKLIAAGGNSAVMGDNHRYWSSTEYAADRAVDIILANSSSGGIYVYNNPRSTSEYVRAFLAF